ncbi:hypothetical protein HC723_13870 [Vibrio sp. S11_S32]|uniref:hypothetical protein n=1 Tax=Vibrio sp. S11_S32 TaxID=2720225 RepID=UPI001680D73B|nr:hypothetical protein [Vibrio sp. S11_S32]MBD1577502.1 hypothetical protein [Vibrio sp. S11_S32]
MMSGDCCDASCVTGYAFIPTAFSSYLVNIQFIKIAAYTPQYSSLHPKSLYRPPIA